MPIHIRAEPGEYAEAVLLPGDPLRAKHIAETFLTEVEQRNSERGLLGYTGLQGPPGFGAGHRHGLPGRHDRLRGADPAGLQEAHPRRHLRRAAAPPRPRRPDRRHLGVPADSTAMHLVNNEPHCPTAAWSLIHGAVHVAKEQGQPLHVGPIVSSDLFYNPNEGQYERWSKRGVLAVEMEAAALFTVGALRGRRGGLPVDRQRHHRRGRLHAHHRRRAQGERRADDEDRARSRDRRLSQKPYLLPRQSGVGERRHRQALARAAPTAPRASACRARRCSPSGPAT